jgi:LemA protein
METPNNTNLPNTSTSNANTTSMTMPKISKPKTIWIVLGIVVILGIWAISSYNGLVVKSQEVTTQWAKVETQYQRRFDLIPNLVESVKGVMKQETEIFTALANARQGYAGAQSVDQKVAAAGQVESSLGRLLAVVENYPTLKSSENMQTLLAQLEGTENRIATERSRYNDVVNDYNIKVRTFPGSVFASIFGFTAKTPFASVEGAQNAVPVKF